MAKCIRRIKACGTLLDPLGLKSRFQFSQTHNAGFVGEQFYFSLKKEQNYGLHFITEMKTVYCVVLKHFCLQVRKLGSRCAEVYRNIRDSLAVVMNPG